MRQTVSQRLLSEPCRTVQKTKTVTLTGSCSKRQLPIAWDLQGYTEAVPAYITKGSVDVTVTKTTTSRANQKPGLTVEVWMLLRIKDAAFRSGERAVLKAAITNLSHGIREANLKSLW